ncbi:MAG: bifunctional phosphoglucose/phosphomannose isomerase [Candidatus Omnitrophota bacterium]
MPKVPLTLNNITKVDRSGMLEFLLGFPSQCKAAYEIAKNLKIKRIKRKFEKIVFAGVGGSAMGADFIKSYLYLKSKFPVLVIKEYVLPEYVDSSTIVFILSYSGNTHEVLNAYKQARQKGAYIICVSSGGALDEYSRRDEVMFIKIPSGLLPRCAFGFLSIIPLCILSKLGIIKNVDKPVDEVIGFLEKLRDDSLSPRIGQKDNIAKYIAGKLYDKFVVIYSGSMHFDIIASRLRGELAENSKTLSSMHTFPEINHNEIMGWENPKKLLRNFVVLMLRDNSLDHRVAKSMELTRGIIKKEGVEVYDLWSQGNSLFSRMFSLIYIGDYISFYLAILYGVDPTPIGKIDYLKERLADSR